MLALSARVHAAQAAKEKGGRKDVSAVALRMPYLRVVGLQEQAEGAHGTPDFTCGPRCIDCLLCVSTINTFSAGLPIGFCRHALQLRVPSRKLRQTCRHMIRSLPVSHGCSLAGPTRMHCCMLPGVKSHSAKAPALTCAQARGGG